MFELQNVCLQMVLNDQPTDSELAALEETFAVRITKLAENTYRVECSPECDLRHDLCHDLVAALNDMRDQD